MFHKRHNQNNTPTIPLSRSKFINTLSSPSRSLSINVLIPSSPKPKSIEKNLFLYQIIDDLLYDKELR